MIVSRMHILTLLSIYILIGSMANNANGDCDRPNSTNPYAILLDPDQQTYIHYYPIEFSCIDGHTKVGLPDMTYCGNEEQNTSWDPDPSEGRCEAQCNTSNLLDDDIVVMVNGSQQILVDSRTTAQLSCRDLGQFTGLASAICTNGTFDYSAEPSCLAYCPVYLEELGVGLYYDIADAPVINETNTLYYRDGDEITYRCSDGYEGPNNRTSSDDGTSTCNDGSWDPPGFPACVDFDECSDNPCQNNATCYDLINEYQCQCAEGFNGSNCENNIDDCANHTCQNGAMCVDKIASYECQCPEGFNGINCENAIMTTEASTTEGLATATTGVTFVTADATSITPGLTTVTPDATTVTPDATTVGSGVTIVTPDATTVNLSVPTVTPDATTFTIDSTTVGSGMTSVTPDATSITPGLTTVTSDATTVTSAMSTETAPPTVPKSTTKSDSTTSSTSTASIPDTTETESVRLTSPDDPTEPSPTESKVTTASQKTSPTTPERTEKPPTTPLPCGGECKATQVCNAENECECRPDYYEDEDDEENPCKEPTSIDVTIKITEVNDTDAEYKAELEDPLSQEFKELEKDVCEPFNEIYANDLEYKGCRVLEFRNGSIIVNYALTFGENSNQSTSTVNKTVQQELQNPNGSFTGDYEFDDASLVVTPLDECTKKIDDCDENANCTDQRENGYTCVCREGYDDVGTPKSLPGRECMKPTEPQPTEPQPTDPGTTKEPEEPGLEPWKVIVGVTVPIISILTITIVGLTCWQYRRLHRTSPSSAMSKMRTFPYDDDTGGSSDHEASRPGSMMIMNNDGTVQEVVLPWRNIPPEEEFIFAPDNNAKGRTQMLPMVDYPNDYAGSASYENDPLGNIVDSYDNYTYQHHDTRNSTEIDSKYF